MKFPLSISLHFNSKVSGQGQLPCYHKPCSSVLQQRGEKDAKNGQGLRRRKGKEKEEKEKEEEGKE